MTVRGSRTGAAGICLLVVLLAGCGGGAKRFPVSGTVTYAGKPVPAGEIALSPDSSKGNEGPGSLARIVNGRFATEPGLGVVGGPYSVRITPFDGVLAGDSTAGTPLLTAPYRVQVDFPKEPSTRDFDIPQRPGR